MRIGRLDLMQVLFDSVFVAPGVAAEIESFALPQWIEVSEPVAGTAGMTFPQGLGRGETETILLSLRMCPDITILDEGAGGGKVVGDQHHGGAGLPLAGKSRGLLSFARADVNALRAFLVSYFREIVSGCGGSRGLVIRRRPRVPITIRCISSAVSVPSPVSR